LHEYKEEADIELKKDLINLRKECGIA